MSTRQSTARATARATARRTWFHQKQAPVAPAQLHMRVTAYVVNAAGDRVGNPVHTVHPLSMPARIEERASLDGLRMVYEITAGAPTGTTACVGQAPDTF